MPWLRLEGIIALSSFDFELIDSAWRSYPRTSVQDSPRAACADILSESVDLLGVGSGVPNPHAVPLVMITVLGGREMRLPGGSIRSLERSKAAVVSRDS